VTDGLEAVLAGLAVRRRPGTWCVVTGPAPPTGTTVAASVVEDEGTTSVIRLEDARRAGIPVDFVAAWLTVEVVTGLELVGLTAAIAHALAVEGIACNVLAGYYHDHLLVPVDDADRALDVLAALRAVHPG